MAFVSHSDCAGDLYPIKYLIGANALRDPLEEFVDG
jgi:hypothetical protein